MAPRAVGIPVRAAEPGEGRDQEHPAGRVALQGELLDLRGLLDDPEAVSEPLDGRPGGEDRSLQRVRRSRALRGVQQPGDRREQAVRGRRYLCPDVHQHERAGAVRVLGVAGREGGLAEESGVLVSGDPGDGHTGAARRVRAGDSEHAAGGQDLRQRLDGNAEQRAQVRMPPQGPDVEQHRAAGVGGVGGVHLAAGEVPHDPAVDRPQREVGAVGYPALGEHPLQLGSREVRVEHESGALAHHGQGTVAFELGYIATRSVGPATRWPGGPVRSAAGSRPPPSRAGWSHRSPRAAPPAGRSPLPAWTAPRSRSRRRRARPARAWGSTGGTRAGPRRRSGRSRRKRWSARWWCPHRWPERQSCR